MKIIPRYPIHFISQQNSIVCVPKLGWGVRAYNFLLDARILKPQLNRRRTSQQWRHCSAQAYAGFLCCDGRRARILNAVPQQKPLMLSISNARFLVSPITGIFSWPARIKLALPVR